MLPGNAKCSMTSLADTKHIFRERKIYLRSLEFRSWLRPRAVSRLRARFARDKIIKSLRSELLATSSYSFCNTVTSYSHANKVYVVVVVATETA